MSKHQSDSMGQLPPKKRILTRKSQTIFMAPIASEKDQICEIWRQKSQSGNPAYRACERIVRWLVFIA